MKISPLEDKLLSLCDELRKVAEGECQNINPDAVHFLVSEIRRLQRLPHALKMRGILK